MTIVLDVRAAAPAALAHDLGGIPFILPWPGQELIHVDVIAPAPPPRRVMIEDPHAAHQIRLRVLDRDTFVSCTCRASWPGHGGRPRYEAIEARAVFPAAEAIACWRAWHEQRRIGV